MYPGRLADSSSLWIFFVEFSLPLLIDLFSDQPLVYRATAGGFIIYPVGEDGIDNGGGAKPDETEGKCRFEVQYWEATQHHPKD